MESIIPQKKCTGCGEIKSIENFYFYNTRQYHTARCKQCYKAASRERYARTSLPKKQAPPPTEKKCTKCQRVLPIDDFFLKKSNSHKRQSHCKACVQEYKQMLYATDKGKLSLRANLLRNHYGITMQQYNELFEAQGGVCACCKRPETHTIRGVPLSLAVDHDHETGEVRGLLCHSCNTAYGLLQEDTDRILALLAYHEQQNKP